MKRWSALVLLAGALAACSDGPVGPSTDGPQVAASVAASVGTAAALQTALDAAATDPSAGTIQLTTNIVLTAPLTYGGALPLTLDGQGYTIDASGLTNPDVVDEPGGDGGFGQVTGADALVVLGTADVTLRNLTIADAGGFGVYVELPSDAAGVVRVTLDGVSLVDNGLSGLWIEDQTHLLKSGGSWVGESDIDSPASIRLDIRDSDISGNGFAGSPGQLNFLDFDAVRVNEGGDGDIDLNISGSSFTENAGDGLELDEKGDGNTFAEVRESEFNDNGTQPQDNRADPDTEDGFDIDEAGAGSVHVLFVDTDVMGNHDEGIDLDEEGTGDIDVNFRDVVASGNNDDNIKLSEDAELEDGDPAKPGNTGNISIQFTNVTSSGSLDGDGFKVEEFGPGNLTGRLTDSAIINNDSDGLDAEQVEPGTGVITLVRTRISGNGSDDIDTDGVKINGG